MAIFSLENVLAGRVEVRFVFSSDIGKWLAG